MTRTCSYSAGSSDKIVIRWAREGTRSAAAGRRRTAPVALRPVAEAAPQRPRSGWRLPCRRRRFGRRQMPATGNLTLRRQPGRPWRTPTRRSVRSQPPSPGCGSLLPAPTYWGTVAADRAGAAGFHTTETRPGWVHLKRRDGDALPVDVGDSAGACRFSTASPAPRWNNPSAGVTITKHRQGGFSSELHTPPSPAAHVGVGTGLEHWPGTALSTSTVGFLQVIHSNSCNFVSHPSARNRGARDGRRGSGGRPAAWSPGGRCLRSRFRPRR